MVLNQTLGHTSLRQDLNRLFYAAPIAGQGFGANGLYASSFYGTQPWATTGFYGQPFAQIAPMQAGAFQTAALPYSSLQPMMGQQVHFVPRANAAETPEAVVYTVELPGVELSQVALSIHGNILVLEGVRQPGGLIADRMISYQHAEGRFGTFRWVAPIHNGCMPAAIDATLRNGLLTIVLPKAGAQIATNSLNGFAAQSAIAPVLSNQAGISQAPVAQVVISQANNA